ncbi:hypothetical protein AK812_SmicGene34668 [Symbiodinium microadriaticum]|uniref:Uncharacterized protein n=1 Tax=Symbiodinium microadriaticum TaxID=2951 RepID=A0A1Q9CNI1_SYMMI|nr:hypothetical protein AK812_SmicGene34668 [Symbiodinium microadriaticum]
MANKSQPAASRTNRNSINYRSEGSYWRERRKHERVKPRMSGPARREEERGCVGGWVSEVRYWCVKQVLSQVNEPVRVTSEGVSRQRRLWVSEMTEP